MTTTVHIRVGQHAKDDVLVTTVGADGRPFGPPVRLEEGQETAQLVHSRQRLLVTEIPKGGNHA